MTISRTMGLLLRFGCGCLILAGMASAESAPAAPVPAAKQLRALDAMALHGVWYSPNVYLPFYGDSDLVAYLAGIPSKHTLLPVYSPSPVHFRRGGFVFVSTALILESPTEGDLLRVIAPDLGNPPSPGDASRFRDLQSKLASAIAEYANATRPQLRRR